MTTAKQPPDIRRTVSTWPLKDQVDRILSDRLANDYLKLVVGLGAERELAETINALELALRLFKDEFDRTSIPWPVKENDAAPAD